MSTPPAPAASVVPDAAANLAKYLDVKTAATALGIRSDTLYDWIQEGRVRVHRLGAKGIRIHVDDLEALFKPEPLRAVPPVRRPPGRPRKHPVAVTGTTVADPP